MSKEKAFGKHSGHVFGYFRKAKGFTLKEAVGDIAFPSQLSNFEHGKICPSADNFLLFLQNINVSSLEFQYALDEYLQRKNITEFGTPLTDSYLAQNISQLKIFQKNAEKRYVSNPDNKHFRLDKIHIEGVLSIVDTKYELSKEDKRFLYTYLINLKEWGLYDISLLGACVTNLGTSELSKLLISMISSAQIGTKIKYVKKAMLQTLLNGLDVFIGQRLLNLTIPIVLYLEENIHEYDMYEKTIFIYDKAKIDYFSGNPAALEIMKECQAIFEFCECFSSADIVAKEIDELVNS